MLIYNDSAWIVVVKQFLLRQIILNVIILNKRNPLIDFLHLLRDYIHCCYVVVLG